jgi:hypothetical protein
MLLLLLFHISQVRLHYAAKNPELEKIEIEKRAEEQARLK